jgi:hypothetical protein
VATFHRQRQDAAADLRVDGIAEVLYFQMQAKGVELRL